MSICHWTTINQCKATGSLHSHSDHFQSHFIPFESIKPCLYSTASSRDEANRSLPFIKGSGRLAGPWDEFPSPDISQSSVTQSSGSRVAVQWYSISRVSFDLNYIPVTFEWHSSDSSVAVEWQSIGRVCFKSNYIPVTFQWHLSDSPVAVQWQLSGNLLVELVFSWLKFKWHSSDILSPDISQSSVT